MGTDLSNISPISFLKKAPAELTCTSAVTIANNKKIRFLFVEASILTLLVTRFVG